MKYGFPAWCSSSALGGAQTFPPWEETRTPESRKPKQKPRPGASSPLPARRNVSQRRRLPVPRGLAKRLSERRGDDAPRPQSERNDARRSGEGRLEQSRTRHASPRSRRRSTRPQGISRARRGSRGCSSPIPSEGTSPICWGEGWGAIPF